MRVAVRRRERNVCVEELADALDRLGVVALDAIGRHA